MVWFRTTSARAAIRLFTLWMAICWSGFPQAMAQQSADEQQHAARAVGQLQNSLLAIEDARHQAPRDHWDPQYVVDTVGIDAKDLFAWVRREVRWVPYRGALRGPVGVLMDRNGNSLDQSLLLAALLHAAGHEVRLAHAELPRETAAKVWQALAEASAMAALARAPTGSASASAATQVSDPGIAPTADLYGLDPVAAVKSIDDSARTAAALADRLDERLVKQSLRILSMLSLPPPAEAQSAADAAAFVDLTDHWWVQVRQASAWLDLDLLNPSGEMGQALVAARDTMLPDALPPAETHRVVMRIVTEQLKAGKTQEHAILEHELKPSELIGEHITLRHFPMLWPTDFQAITPEDVNTKMFAALATQTEWLPVLDVGETHFKQASIHDTGTVNPKPDPPSNPFLSIGASSGGSAAAAADVLRGGNLVESNSRVDAPKDARADGELTAEWIEYEIDVPGEKPQTLRREVFDILGANARAAGSLASFQLTPEKALTRSMAMLSETELLVLPCELASDFVLEMASRTALANREFATDLTSDPFGKTPANSSEIVAKMAPLPGPAYGLVSLRFDNRLDPGTVFVDRPTILAQHAILTSAGPGALAVKVALDIVAHPVGVGPFSNVDPFIARIMQGISDTNAEALALPDSDKARSNTADAFEKADAADWLLLTPADEAEVAKLGLEPEIAMRLVADLRRGDLVVAGKTSGAAGWWRIDPTTGETLGVSPSGWGQAMVEYAFVLVIQMYLAQIACLVQANVMGKLEGTVNTAADAHANARKNFNHCLTFAFLGVLNGMTTAYFMNRLQTTSSTSPPSAPSTGSPPPAGRLPNTTQPLPPRPPPGPGRTQPASPGGPPPGTSPPGPSAGARPGSPPPGSPPPGGPAFDKTQPAPPRLAANAPTNNSAPNPWDGPYKTDYTWLERRPALQDVMGSIDKFKSVDAKAAAAYDSARANGANHLDARAASEGAWWDAFKGNSSPPTGPRPAAPGPMTSPLATTGIGAFNAAMKGT